MKKPKIKPESRMHKKSFFVPYHVEWDNVEANAFRLTPWGARSTLEDIYKTSWKNLSRGGWRIVKVRISECKK